MAGTISSQNQVPGKVVVPRRRPPGPVQAVPRSACELRAVAATTRRGYAKHFAAFVAWAATSGRMMPQHGTALDHLLMDFLDHLLATGSAAHVGETTVAAVRDELPWATGLPLPRVRRALVGFRKAHPPRSRAPLALEIVGGGHHQYPVAGGGECRGPDGRHNVLHVRTARRGAVPTLGRPPGPVADSRASVVLGRHDRPPGGRPSPAPAPDKNRNDGRHHRSRFVSLAGSAPGAHEEPQRSGQRTHLRPDRRAPGGGFPGGGGSPGLAPVVPVPAPTRGGAARTCCPAPGTPFEVKARGRWCTQVHRLPAALPPAARRYGEQAAENLEALLRGLQQPACWNAWPLDTVGAPPRRRRPRSSSEAAHPPTRVRIAGMGLVPAGIRATESACCTHIR